MGCDELALSYKLAVREPLLFRDRESVYHIRSDVQMNEHICSVALLDVKYGSSERKKTETQKI